MVFKKQQNGGVYGTVAWLIADTIDELNAISNTSRTVPYPNRHKGKWTAICRVDDQSIDQITANGKSFAFGFGIDKSMPGARKKAEKMAKDILGSNNVHHPVCKCISPTGDTDSCGR